VVCQMTGVLLGVGRNQHGQLGWCPRKCNVAKVRYGCAAPRRYCLRIIHSEQVPEASANGVACASAKRKEEEERGSMLSR
jgi:hypothetical protein